MVSNQLTYFRKWLC